MSYILLSLAYLIACILTRRLLNKLGENNLIKFGVCLFVLSIAILYIVSLFSVQHAVEIILPLAFLMGANGIIVPLSIGGAVSLSSMQAGQISSLVGFIPMLLSGIATSIVHHFAHGSLTLIALFMGLLSISSIFGVCFFDKKNINTNRVK